MPLGGTDPNRMSFLQHLEELRARLLRIVAVLAVGFFAAWPASASRRATSLPSTPVPPVIRTRDMTATG